MHRCLRVDELLREIFEQVRVVDDLVEEDWDWDYQTISRLARTCKTFLRPALDRLWHSQDTLSNLIGTLPASAWTLDGNLMPNRLVRSSDT